MLLKFTAAIAALTPLLTQAQEHTPPNFVVIFCDDMGYGDLACYGDPSVRTPNIDRMASEGQKWSSFYVAASVSTPSRAALLTGRYPMRNGQTEVYRPFSENGLPQSEITIAGMLKSKNYTTACVGKWHLGHLPEYLPLQHGFDYFYGLPYSNDMSKKEQQLMGVYEYQYTLPFYNQDQITEQEPDQSQFTRRLTEYATDFITTNKDNPFFLYLTHPMPHIPVYASDDFRGRSLRGKYGDTMEEIDWSVGEILKTLADNGLDSNTLVVFTSDNGPWLITDDQSGSAGVLRDGKGSAYEGGFRVPCIFWGRGFVEPSYVNEMGATLDLFPTICQLAGIPIPSDRTYDGESLVEVLKTGHGSPRNDLFYYREDELYAARQGNYKAIFATKPTYTPGDKVVFDTPELYNLGCDPEERHNIAAKNPDIVKQITELVKRHKENVKQ